jgi:peptidoglycan/LPS O-acetylase OafA/YrhL
MITEPKHFAYIDAVRGTAFLMVLAHHAALCVESFPGKREMGACDLGVQLFFLASAITLFSSMAVRSRIDQFPIGSFYLRRLFRIAPLFWLAIIFYGLLPDVAPPQFWLTKWAPNGLHPSYFVLTELFIHGWHPYTFNSIVPGGWSIAVEMTFYAVFPFLFLWLNSLARSIAAAVLFGFGAWFESRTMLWLHHYQWLRGLNPQVYDFFVWHWFPTQCVVFVLGIVIYHLLKSSAVALVRNRAGALSLFLFGLAIWLAFAANYEFLPFLIMVVAMAAMIFAISARQVPLVVNAAICYVGRISYSCYLVHFAALGMVLRFLHLHLTYEHQSFDAGGRVANGLLFLAIFGLGLLFTIPVATITMHLIENPSIECGRRLLKWINPVRAKGPVPAADLPIDPVPEQAG